MKEFDYYIKSALGTEIFEIKRFNPNSAWLLNVASVQGGTFCLAFKITKLDTSKPISGEKNAGSPKKNILKNDGLI